MVFMVLEEVGTLLMIKYLLLLLIQTSQKLQLLGKMLILNQI